jgi:hypothetical protein
MNNLLAQDFGDKFFGQPGHFLTKITGPSTLVSLFLSNSLIVGGVILLFIIIFAGYGIIGAGGNPQKVAAAMKLLTYGIAGFLLIFAAYFIVTIIQTLTGTNLVQ